MKASLNGISVEFTDRGSGPVALLVHGFPLDRRIWSDQLQDLSRECRVIAPDLRGHGRTAAPDGTYTMETLATDLLALVDALRIERFVPVGHSMGGYAAFALHRLAPQRLAGAVLVATRAKADSDEARRVRLDTAQRVQREGVRFLAESMPDRLLHIEAPKPVLETVRDIITIASSTGVVGALRGMAERPDSTAQLATIRCPVLVVGGRGDRIVPPAETEEMAKAIPGARMLWLERSGHMPMMEEAEAFNAAVLAFMKTLPA